MNNPAMPNFTIDELQRLDQFRKQHHTALLTILFVDLADSTGWAESLGDETFTELLTQIESAFRTISEDQFNGLFIKNTGDGGLVVFAEPTAAVNAAEAIRDTLSRQVQSPVPGRAIKVRQGIHLGQVTMRESLSPDVFGKHVNRAARIADAAQPDQILASYGVWDNVQMGREDREEAWKTHGQFWLRGVGEAVPIFECLKDGFSLGNPRAKAVKNALDHKKMAVLVGALSILLVGTIVTAVVLVQRRGAQTPENETVDAANPGPGGPGGPGFQQGQINSFRQEVLESIRAKGTFTFVAEASDPNPILAEAKARRDATVQVLEQVFGQPDDAVPPMIGNLRRTVRETILSANQALFEVVNKEWNPQQNVLRLHCRTDAAVLADQLEATIERIAERFRQRPAIPQEFQRNPAGPDPRLQQGTERRIGGGRMNSGTGQGNQTGPRRGFMPSDRTGPNRPPNSEQP